ncbi:MAG: hypothetical protein KZQ83_17805 [gamma proteobacterium symbiont of Taylorina sp.]|nr:hypothetical protein [gamma proteobacterium symbiont of Taylorina sp.]
MINSSNEHLKDGLPEKYFTIPKGETIDPNILGVAMSRIETVVEVLVCLESSGDSEDKASDLIFLLEGLVYQAKELAGAVK